MQRAILIISILRMICAATAVAQELPAGTPPAPPQHRMGWEDRFAAANTAHDGHLTLEQARQGYKSVARHFADIDQTGKGYVTADDIRAWHAAQRTMRHHPGEDGTRPRHAYQRLGPTQHPTAGAATQSLVPVPVEDHTDATPASVTVPAAPAAVEPHA